ncbi:RsmD family RNA methyltransferase [Maribacter algicola]|uniref:RsmD family RNA methyltransferase n=1 Tax=Meishania litoralis TaxID=3434685 RepID=A0ACC7LMS3_9FLAO
MRIISGIHKGRRLIAPKNLPVRPTTDMAKEGLFNILNNEYYFGDLKVLDLFAGTGNISYEFASRGVERIMAVDDHKGCINFISKTSEQLDLAITPLKSNVFSFLQKTTEKFDIVFGDPPYDMALEDFERIVRSIFTKNLILNDGVLILEHAKQTDLSRLPQFRNARKYGGSVFSFFVPQEPN